MENLDSPLKAATYIKRMRSPMPRFWKKIGIFSASIAATCTLIIGTSAAVDLPLGDNLLRILKISVVAGTAVGSMSIFTKKDAEIKP